jgi:hypothetical protein
VVAILLLVALLDLVISMSDKDGPSQRPLTPIPVGSNLPEAEGQPLEAGVANEAQPQDTRLVAPANPEPYNDDGIRSVDTEERDHAGFSLWKLTLVFAAVIAALAGVTGYAIFRGDAPSTSVPEDSPVATPFEQAVAPEAETAADSGQLPPPPQQEVQMEPETAANPEETPPPPPEPEAQTEPAAAADSDPVASPESMPSAPENWVRATVNASDGIIVRQAPGGNPIGGLIDDAGLCVDPASRSAAPDGNVFLQTANGDWVAQEFIEVGDDPCFEAAGNYVRATVQAQDGIYLRQQVPGGNPIGGLVDDAGLCVDPDSQKAASDGNVFLQTADGNWVAQDFIEVGTDPCFE